MKRSWQHYQVYLKRFKTTPKDIFEMGCGIGLFLEACVHNDRIASGCEIDPWGVALCLAKGFRVHQHDLSHPLTFLRNESYDAVFSNQVIEHLSKSAQLLMINEAFRILRRGGELLIQSPCRFYPPARTNVHHNQSPDTKRARKPDYGGGIH